MRFKNKIGVLGGSFDPAHIGHLAISKKAVKEYKLKKIIWAITLKNPLKKSYVSSLFDKGIHKIAQKVGEESFEMVIEAIANNEQLFMEEAADLFFHYLILLKSKGKSLEDVLLILEDRKRG